MKEFKGSEIRNIAVVGHGASGKTSLVDALAFVSGASKRHGAVKDGTSLTDTAPEEIERGYSINLGVAHAEWLGTKINLIDTPGFLDFQGDAVAGLAAADGALCVVSANSGVEVGTERMFREAVKRRDPVLFVVSMMDKEHADFDRIYEQVKTRLTSKVIPVEVPLGDGPDFHGVINLFTKKALLFKQGSKSGEFHEVDIPADYRTQFDRYYQELIESISSTDDTLLERYLEGGEIGRDEAIAGMKEAMKRMELFPLFCVSSELNYGVQAVLNTIVELLPNAFEMEEVHAFKGAEGNATVEIHADDTKPFTALVFKTMSEPHVGDVSFFRVFSGCIVNGQEVFNATRDIPEKLNHLSVAQGKERVEVNRLCAGDIGCVAKLKNTHTNDTLSTREHPVRLPQIEFPEPIIELTIISGVGERHLEISLAKLRRKYGVQAQLTRPKIAYRETLKARAEGQGKHKKQTGGRGQFGDCWVRIAPAPRGGGYEFIDKIVGGAIPRQYIPAVDRGIQEASVRGVLAGYPVVDFKVEVFDGSFHTVDSNEQSFKMAGIQAFKSVAPKCKPVLLEPLAEIDVVTPDEYMGDVLGDLSARRGHILGTEAIDSGIAIGGTRVRAIVPEAELHSYAGTLQSMTQGRATFTKRFKGYEEVPHEVAQRVIEGASKEQEEAAVH